MNVRYVGSILRTILVIWQELMAGIHMFLMLLIRRDGACPVFLFAPTETGQAPSLL